MELKSEFGRHEELEALKRASGRSIVEIINHAVVLIEFSGTAFQYGMSSGLK
jgi:hypothetical protein